MTARAALAVDGGNSKSDLAVVNDDGELLAFRRGGPSSPHHLGLEPALDVLGDLFRDATAQAGVAPPVDVAQLLLAGVDFPSEVEQTTERAARRGWATRVAVENDTFAVLRAGTERRWGVAVVCGAGINCVGVAPDGRHARFPALGAITGDWGGGYDVGLAAVSAAARSEDGRGRRTTLERAVPEHFGFATPTELAEAFHARRLDQRRVIELAPVVFREAADDAVAAEIVERLAAEVVTLVRVALARLDLMSEPADVLLGGGLMRSADGRLLDAVEAGLREVGPELAVRATASPPIVGAALLALDELGAPHEAYDRVRAELGAAVERVEAA